MGKKEGEERSGVRIHEESRKFQDTSLNNWNTNRGIGALCVDSQPVDPRREIFKDQETG